MLPCSFLEKSHAFMPSYNCAYLVLNRKCTCLMYLKSPCCTVCCVCWVGCEARRTKFQSLRIKVPAPPMTARRINLNLNKMNYIYIHITLAKMGEERATGTEYQFQNIMHYFTFFILDLVPFFLF